MKFRVLFISALLLNYLAVAQCPTAGFQIQETACLNQRIVVTNESTNAIDFEWDYCAGDLLKLPVALSLPVSTGVGTLTGVEAVEDDGSFFVFITGRTSNSITRIALGNDIRNPEPVVTELGSFGGLVNGPGGIKFLKENGIWYSIVYNSGTDKLLRINFGSSLGNTPTTGDAEEIVTSYGGANNGMDLVSDDGKIICAITQPSTGSVSLINFGNSITNNPVDPTDILTISAIAGADLIRGIHLVNECDVWYGYCVNSGNNKILRLDFGSDLFSTPAIVDITGSPVSGAENFVDIKVSRDGDNYIGMILTVQGTFHRLNFGSDPAALPSISPLGNLSVVNNTLFFDVIKQNSTWSLFAGNFSSNEIFRADFENDCDIELTEAKDDTHTVSFLKAGSYSVFLKAIDEQGHPSYASKILTVSGEPAPDLNIGSVNNCVENDIFFSTENSSGNLTSVSWDFGDLSTPVADVNPAHRYDNTGEFDVILEVLADNGCSNRTSKTVTIYDAPIAAFSLPADVVCTNDELTFTNDTDDSFEGLLAYEWSVNNELVSTDRDLQYVFEVGGGKEIKLAASIPGCTSEALETIANVAEGPIVNFSTDGNCEGEDIAFNNESSENVIGFHWDLGGLLQTSDTNPSFTFAPGSYNITLEAFDEKGCVSTIQKELTINDKPIVDFEILDATICSKATLVFEDLTQPPDSPLAEWQWEFGDDQKSELQSPDHTYTLHGTYNVSLTVMAESGCSDSVEKSITVNPSPDADFSHTATCKDLPTDFKGPSQSDIISWEWQIGEKNYSSQDVSHTFRNSGIYSVDLVVISSNGCQANSSSTVSVPTPLMPLFRVEKNCIGEMAKFVDLTMDTDDPVEKKEWKIDGTIALDNEAPEFTFTAPGDHEVTLTVTGGSGCTYFVKDIITVVPHPKASFIMSSEIGSPPFPVDFTNRSEDATDYAWDFGDGNISNEASPTHDYTEVGEFTITLTASNPERCEHSSTKEISISPAKPDIRIMAVTATENPDKTVGILVTLHNDGNTIIYDLPLDIDISGTVNVREIIEGPVLPRSRVNFSLGYGLNITEEISFLCATATLAGDVEPETNRNCIEFASKVVFLPGYPNPAKEFLHIEWVAPHEETVQVSLKNTLGNEIWTLQFESKRGLNQKLVEVENLQKGIYMLILESSSVTTMQRILIAR